MLSSIREQNKTKILLDLVRKYETRKKKSSDFKSAVSIRITDKTYPDYFSDQELYDSSFYELEKLGFITIKKYKNSQNIEEVILNLELIEDIYEFLGKENIQNKIDKLFEHFQKYDNYKNQELRKTIEKRMSNKLSINKYLSDDFFNIVKLIYYLEINDHDIYERNFSAHIFNDSKRVEKLRKQVIKIYDNEDIFIIKGVLKVPTYIYMKGKGKIVFNNQIIDLELIETSIGIPSDSLDYISFTDVNVVTTIENLTTYNVFNGEGLIVYLGGFSNSSQDRLLQKIKKSNPTFNHFGDIDYGGFLILNNLINVLGVNVIAINMDIDTIIKNRNKAIKINDKKYIKKLKSLLTINSLKEHYQTIEYLIDNKIKFEQENI